MHNKYTYDAVDNILGIANTASPQELSNNKAKLDGESSHTYQYDALNRLISASGSAKDASYTLNMAYNVMSMPVPKMQNVENSNKADSYSMEYKYEDAANPSAPSQIGHEHYTYDANGNPVRAIWRRWRHRVLSEGGKAKLLRQYGAELRCAHALQSSGHRSHAALLSVAEGLQHLGRRTNRGCAQS